jgi:hypothetical protein
VGILSSPPSLPWHLDLSLTQGSRISAYYPNSDLDLYVPCKHATKVALWLEGNGYVFVPSDPQRDKISNLDRKFKYYSEFQGVEGGMRIAGTAAESFIHSLSNEYDDTLKETSWDVYATEAIEAVLSFVRPTNEHDVQEKVDVIVIEPEASPLVCILGFHSSMSLLDTPPLY